MHCTQVILLRSLGSSPCMSACTDFGREPSEFIVNVGQLKKNTNSEAHPDIREKSVFVTVSRPTARTSKNEEED